jgi:ABC-type Fe3+-hydroxamate transport system substrate-binding protein
MIRYRRGAAQRGLAGTVARGRRGAAASPGPRVTAPILDASGAALALPAPPRRVVSLIPSITDLVFALGRGPAVVGCTIFCTEPAEGVRSVARIGGEKNPDLERIRALRPDLVIANVEENVREHVDALRAAGIAVYVTYPRTVADGIRLVRDLGRVLGAESAADALAGALDRALADARAGVAARGRARVFCPIWRRPWMSINGDTYVHDMLRECGGDNVCAAAPRRYPEVTLEEIAAARPEVILLPDEPYRFRRVHAADFTAYPDIPALAAGRVHLIDGKLLSWYGPRIAQALETLPPLLAGAAAPG